ncbi:TetR/AcrR family transcriptional regulator [Propionispora vibrioides]|jgi:TetR/AcrR family transcriptional regulator|uniref:Transcriptional regulator, TetR family n=1 Tax=Propionispora vibrioides TaxID=112903 RepID=A0A1H8VYJ9_9FIRM|nr:TetR family transcriptional regulator [Propionispora vibrioides]SEP20469.1 transcriptional regulator, TetR family [Propionispora vibrioides]
MKNDTANKILDNATFLFAKLGFETVTVNQLAREAKSNPAAISYYFGNKENLYQEVLRRQFSPPIQSLKEIEFGSGTTATERLLTYTNVLTAIQYKQPYLSVFWQREMSRHPTTESSFFVREYTLQLYQYIVSSLRHGISQEEFLADLEPFHTASVLVEMLHAPHLAVSLLPQELNLSDKANRKNYIMQSIHYCLQGIRC